MTLNQQVSDIRNIATSGSNSVDFRVEDSQIKYWIHQFRAMLISQAIQKKQDITTSWLQTISCLELEQVDSSECCDETTECYVLRTIETLPRTIEGFNQDMIVRVESLNGNVIPRTSQFGSKYDKYAKWSSNKTKWFLKNDRIYVINNQFLSKINVIGIFEDPTTLAAYNSCDEAPCYSDNSNYPCSFKMANDITNLVLKTKIYPLLALPQDTTNDAANEEQPIDPRKV